MKDRSKLTGKKPSPKIPAVSFLMTASMRHRHHDFIGAVMQLYPDSGDCRVNSTRPITRKYSHLKKYIPFGVNFKRVGSTDCIWYTWGAIPLIAGRGRQPPFVIELDNPYAITGYRVKRFRLLRPWIRRLLLADRCKKIVCLSEACRKSLLQELGKEISSKTTVLYPYLPVSKEEKESQKNTAHISLITFASNPRARGLPSTVKAFELLKNEIPDVRLTVVTTGKGIATYKDTGNIDITYVSYDLDRQKVFSLLRAADILIHPTLQDSFGMIILEAISLGLPVIATDVFAISEMIYDGINGYLIKPPLRYYHPDFRANEKLWQVDFEDIAPADHVPELVDSLLLHIKALSDPARRKRMGEESRRIFYERFAPEIWKDRAVKLFSEIGI